MDADSLKETAFECLKAAFEAGVNFFDTAEVYSAGKAEVVLGEAIKKFGWKQNDLVIATKVGWSRAPAAPAPCIKPINGITARSTGARNPTAPTQTDRLTTTGFRESISSRA